MRGTYSAGIAGLFLKGRISARVAWLAARGLRLFEGAGDFGVLGVEHFPQ